MERRQVSIVMEQIGEKHIYFLLSILINTYHHLMNHAFLLLLSSFISGTNLLQGHGEPCNIQQGSDDCEADLVCIQDVNEPTSGKCLTSWHSATWYVNWEDHKCVQDCDGGPNCGGHAGNWHEKFSTFQLCCDHHLSYLGGGYRNCVPDLDYIKEHD